MAKYRILSLDGGGIRGLISTILLQRLSDEAALAGWLDSVDLIAGTSTGGLIALGLAAGLDLKTIRDLYETRGKLIFDDTWLDDLMDLGQIIGADYSNRNLARELKRLFGDKTLRSLKKRVLITSFDLDNEDPNPQKRTWKPKLFNNFPGAGTDGDELAYKVGLYTSAAPTYFPTVDGYVDGGVYANNPSMCALTQSQDKRLRDRPALSDVALLSVGTGTSLVYIKEKNLDWGQAQWVKPLISVMLDGVAGIADFQCQQILSEQYFRIAPVFPPGVSMPLDAVEPDRIQAMVTLATQADLTAAIKWVQTQWL
jgi:uncharacterized protein